MLAWMFQKIKEISQHNFQRFFSPLTGFPTGVENMGEGGSSKFDGGLKSIQGGSIEGA